MMTRSRTQTPRRTACALAVVGILISLISPSVSTADGIPPALTAFMSWFQEVGGDAHALRLMPFDGMGTGIGAVEPVHENDAVIKAPMDVVICRETLLTRAKTDNERRLLRGISADEDLVSVALVRERALGEASEWGPYIAALPQSVPVSYTFSEDELAELQDAREAGFASQRRATLLKQFQQVSPTLDKVMLAAGLSESQVESVPKQAWFLWAISLVHSRALTIRGEKFLVPYADMFNYEPHSADRPAAAGAHFLKYHGQSDGFFVVRADRETAVGEQLFEDYGDNDNNLYLHNHGFVALNNPFDCVRVNLPEPRQSDRLLPMKRRLLNALRLHKDMGVCLSPNDENVSRRVFDYLNVIYMKQLALTQCDSVASGDTSRAALTHCLGKPNTNDGYRRLVKSLKRQLKAYPTSVRKDTTLLDSSDLSDNLRTAVTYRMTRKQLLSKLIAKFESPELREAKASTDSSATTVAAEPDAAAVAHYQGLVTRFNDWFAAAEPPVALLEAAVADGGMRLGTVAVRDIEPEEPYLSVPLKLIIDGDSAFRCPDVGVVLKQLRKKYPRGDPFHELLFHLMYEKFVRPDSFWKPYLDYLPTAEEMIFPAFYSEGEMAEMQASVARELAQDYQDSIKRKYDNLAGLLDQFSDVFLPKAFTFKNYKWAHAILDSRSIWWSGERHLVPLLDLINCAEGPDPSRVHATNLDTAGNNAVTLAPWGFKKGQPVYENYGQPNHIYYMYHGFSLEENTHDCVRIKIESSGELTASQEERLREARLRESHIPCFNPTDLDPREVRFVEIMLETDRSTARSKLKALAEQQLAAYGTSIAEDETLLMGSGLSARFVATVKFRLSEKRLLTELASMPTKRRGGSGRDEL